MEELVKVAECLYWQIDKVIWNLIATRTNKDDKGKKKAISDMETAMCGTQQFLKCILERKDNIVDLGEVWHNIKEEPEYGNPIVYVTKLNKIGTLKRVDKNTYSWYIEKYAICKWAYMKDLLPKGDNK